MNDSANEIAEDGDELALADEGAEKAFPGRKQPWKLLIVDDDEEVHSITHLVLDRYSFEGRPIKFLSAYSGEEAKRMIREHPDTALILLDVVMEEDHSGLDVARYIREDLGNSFVRIVLRTGQPGQAPENQVITDYDINDYKEKTELTTGKLFTTVTATLRAYRDIRTIERSRQELSATHDALAKAHEDLRKLDQLKSVFIAVTSHELKTPLTVIRGMLALIKKRLDKGDGKLDDVRQMLTAVICSSKRLERLVLSTLEIGHSGKFDKHFRTETLKMQDLVNQVLIQVAPFIEIREQTLVNSVPNDLPSTLLDYDKIQDVLTNFIMNAIKFTPNGGLIEISASQPDPATIRVCVRDTGVGIPDEDKPHVFDEFFAGFDASHHSSGDFEFGTRGIGLGLALAREFVRMHGGEIGVKSAPEAGSSFFFTIPVKEEADS